jgi:ornithine carbamoyltransferase
VGDGNNMANTYLEGAVLTGMDIRIATPPAFACSQRIVDECLQVAERTGSQVLITTDPHASLEGADVVITDTWTSMGDEDEHDLRLAAFSGYQIDAKAMSYAADDAIFMHCLPAHRGEEVADEVMDGPWSVIYDEAENRLHAQKALLSLVMG